MPGDKPYFGLWKLSKFTVLSKPAKMKLYKILVRTVVYCDAETLLEKLQGENIETYIWTNMHTRYLAY